MAKQNSRIAALAQLFRILGDETRLRVLIVLEQRGELNVTALCKTLKVPQPTVSHHLGILRMGDLVINRRSGKEIFYSLNDLRRHKYARAMKTLLKGSAAIQLGSIVLGLAE